MHPRVSLHQVVYMKESTASFIELCGAIGVRNMTLATPLVMQQPGGVEAVKRALLDAAAQKKNPRVAVVNHPFALFPNLEQDNGEASKKFFAAIDLTLALGAKSIYLLTGGRGSLSWEQAAERFIRLIAPGKQAAL